jgi:hypothetical protein
MSSTSLYNSWLSPSTMAKTRSILDHIGEMLDGWLEERFDFRFDATLLNVEETVVDSQKVVNKIENDVKKIADRIELLRHESKIRDEEVRRHQKT